jgi:hypothetical protein
MVQPGASPHGFPGRSLKYGSYPMTCERRTLHVSQSTDLSSHLLSLWNIDVWDL